MKTHTCAKLLLIHVLMLGPFAYAANTSLEKSQSRFQLKKFDFTTSFFATKGKTNYMNGENAFIEVKGNGIQGITNGLNLTFDIRAKAVSNSVSYVEPEHAEGFLRDSKIGLKELKFGYAGKNKNLLLEGGLVNQGVQHNKVLVSRTAFLGVREGYSFQLPFGRLEVTATQARPMVSSFSNNEKEVDTDNITFFNENAKFVPKLSKRFSLEAIVGHHAYNKLNPSVAYNSLFRGNTILGTSKRNAEFAYGFNGWNYSLFSTIQLTPSWKLSFFYQGLSNTKAPQGRGTGNLYGFKGSRLFDSHEIWIEMNTAKIESDATVGSFTSYIDHKPNGITNNFWVGYKNNKDNYSVKAVFQKSTILNPIEFVQGDGSLIQLQLSKAYEIF